MTTLKITKNEIAKDIVETPESFPKYTTQLMNLANQNIKGTRPEVVGQMTELIQEFPGKSFPEWVAWYQSKEPEAIGKATKKVCYSIDLLRDALALIDENMVRRWVIDLVLTKTYAGLHYQESILRLIARRKNLEYKRSTPEEESKGIDGYIGAIPVSIKPTSYKYKAALPERIGCKIIYYEKRDKDIEVEYDF